MSNLVTAFPTTVQQFSQVFFWVSQFYIFNLESKNNFLIFRTSLNIKKCQKIRIAIYVTIFKFCGFFSTFHVWFEKYGYYYVR